MLGRRLGWWEFFGGICRENKEERPEKVSFEQFGGKWLSFKYIASHLAYFVHETSKWQETVPINNLLFLSLSLFKKYLFGCTSGLSCIQTQLWYLDAPLTRIELTLHWDPNTDRQVLLFFFQVSVFARKFYGIPLQWLNIFKAKDSAIFLFSFLALLKEQINHGYIKEILRLLDRIRRKMCQGIFCVSRTLSHLFFLVLSIRILYFFSTLHEK